MAKKEKEEKKEKVSTKKTVSKKPATKKSTTKKATPKEKVVTEVVEVPEEKKKNTVFGRIDKKYELDILDIMIVIVITAIASCVLTGFILNVQFRKMNPTYNLNLSKDENIKELLDVYSEVITNYYQEVDKKGMVEAGINGMLKFLGDNYSIYMNSSAAEDLNETLENTYEGIGIVTTNNVVYHVYDNTPASKAGIKEDDVIIKVNGVDI